MRSNKYWGNVIHKVQRVIISNNSIILSFNTQHLIIIAARQIITSTHSLSSFTVLVHDACLAQFLLAQKLFFSCMIKWNNIMNHFDMHCIVYICNWNRVYERKILHPLCIYYLDMCLVLTCLTMTWWCLCTYMREN